MLSSIIVLAAQDSSVKWMLFSSHFMAERTYGQGDEATSWDPNISKSEDILLRRSNRHHLVLVSLREKKGA